MDLTNSIKKYWAELTLLVIILIGAFLRFYQLSHQGYFTEEIFTANEIKASYYLLAIYPFRNPGTWTPPLYYLAAKLSSDLLGGISTLSLRLPAAIFGTLCIPSIYALGKEYHTKITGLLAALVLALSERMVFYSQYGRTYSLVLLFFILAAYCFVKIQKKENFKRWILLFILASGLCLWSHYYSIVPLSVFWLILIWQNKKAILPYLIVVLIPAIAVILFMRSLIWQYLTTPISVLYPPSPFNIPWTFNLIQVPYECWGYLGILLIPLFLFYLWRKRERTAIYFGLAAGTTYLSMLVLTFIFDPSARYAVLIAPLIIVPALVPVSEFIQNGTDITQRIILFSGMAYIIITANLYPLIAWYTTTYHFVFL